MPSSHRRPLLITLLICGLVAIPLGFLVTVQQQDKLDKFSLNHDSIKFIWPIQTTIAASPSSSTPQPNYLTHQHLYGKVTLLIYLANHHVNQAAPLLNQLSTWIKLIDDSLTIREHFDETQLTTTGVLVSSPEQSDQLISALHLRSRHQAGRWFELNPTPTIRQDLLKLYQIQNPNAHSLPPAVVMIWDSQAKLRLIIDDTTVITSSISSLLAVTSRVHFQSSLNEYLSQRTFFGRKKPRPNQAPPSS